MAAPPPEALSLLLSAHEGEERERAWEAFVAEYSRLIHSVARRSSTDYDRLMDRYTCVLEGLREDGFKRLRGFDPGGRSKFTTWLVVVSTRLCVDYQRKTYGRALSGGNEVGQIRTRRRLVDLVGEEVGMDQMPDGDGHSPEAYLRDEELRSALEASLLRLENEERLLLQLRFEDQRPASEIARLMGLSSEFAAYRRLRTVLERLRGDLERHGVEGPEP